jgi:glycosyltransferase involved in cell wall biosynthesis
MKLNWFSPLPPAHTDIANFTTRLLPCLKREFALELYTENTTWEPLIETQCPVTGFSSDNLDWKKLNLGGTPVYNVGNNIHFHAEVIRAARKCPGIIVLHDLSMHETVLNLCLLKEGGRARYFEILHKFGGEKALSAGKRFLDEEGADRDRFSIEYPLFEHIIENALGVVTHNPVNMEALASVTTAPVLYTPLPFVEKGLMAPPIKREARVSEPYKILIFGFLGGKNRRLRPFLEALATSRVRDRFSLTIAGKYPEHEVRGWIREVGLARQVNLRGYISDAELDELLRDSDLVPNLRWPSFGESSGTLMRIWNFSLPSLVTNTGFYSTVPAETVAHVDPVNEIEDIQRHLEAFVRDPHSYFSMGIAGRQHLERHHSAEGYVKHLKAFLPEVERQRPHIYPQIFGRNLANNYLADYPDPSARHALLSRCSSELADWS